MRRWLSKLWFSIAIACCPHPVTGGYSWRSAWACAQSVYDPRWWNAEHWHGHPDNQRQHREYPK